MENEYLLDYIGKSKTNKIQNELYKLTNELYPKGECLERPMSLIDIHEKDSNEILQIGASVPGDLILDNFGFYVSGYIGVLVSTSFLVDITGATRTLDFRSIGAGNSRNIGLGQNTDNPPTRNMPIGTYFKLGDSLATPLRADFDVNNALGSAPENALQPTNLGTTNIPQGQVKVSKTYPSAGGSGTIREIGLFFSVSDEGHVVGGASHTVMMTHELVSPTVAFVLGQVINVELIWQL